MAKQLEEGQMNNDSVIHSQIQEQSNKVLDRLQQRRRKKFQSSNSQPLLHQQSQTSISDSIDDEEKKSQMIGNPSRE